jgi:hypothetical protein
MPNARTIDPFSTTKKKSLLSLLARVTAPRIEDFRGDQAVAAARDTPAAPAMNGAQVAPAADSVNVRSGAALTESSTPRQVWPKNPSDWYLTEDGNLIRQPDVVEPLSRWQAIMPWGRVWDLHTSSRWVTRLQSRRAKKFSRSILRWRSSRRCMQPLPVPHFWTTKERPGTPSTLFGALQPQATYIGCSQ